MSKQDVLLKGVEIPSGYEATGEFRCPSSEHGDIYLSLNGKAEVAAGYLCCKSIILRSKEPLAIQACRKLVGRHCKDMDADTDSPLDLARRAIAEYEKEQSP